MILKNNDVPDGFMDYDRVTLLQDVESAKSGTNVGADDMSEISLLSDQFCYENKATLKRKDCLNMENQLGKSISAVKYQQYYNQLSLIFSTCIFYPTNIRL